MDQINILKQAGLTETQSKAYLALLANDSYAPPDLADVIGENRTAVYMILARLEELGLARKIDGAKVAYEAESPIKLKELIIKRQSDLQQTLRDLNSLLPSLNARYNISHQKPGVVYLDGIDGLKYVYKELVENNQDFLILPSVDGRDYPEVEELIESNIRLQKAKSIHVRALYPLSFKNTVDVKALEQDSNVHLRFFGQELHHTAQIIIYSNSVAITTFKNGIFTTVITNPLVANTHRGYFEAMWAAARPQP